MKLKATKESWGTFFDSLVWEDLRTLLAEAKEQGIGEIRQPGLDGPALDYIRGKLEHIDCMLDLEQVIEETMTIGDGENVQAE